jgi:hypothetical protein
MRGRSTVPSNRRLPLVATIEDAIEVLSDPANQAGFGKGGMRIVDQSAVLATLAQKGASGEDARALVLEALGQIGGKVEDRADPRQSMRSGGSNRRVIEEWYVPPRRPLPE